MGFTKENKNRWSILIEFYLNGIICVTNINEVKVKFTKKTKDAISRIKIVESLGGQS
jgi:hypothetical protein